MVLKKIISINRFIFIPEYGKMKYAITNYGIVFVCNFLCRVYAVLKNGKSVNPYPDYIESEHKCCPGKC